MNLGGAAIALTDDDLRRIATALAQVKGEGDRYPPQMAAMVGR